MSPRLDEFTTDQIKFALKAIHERATRVALTEDVNEIWKGNCPEWDALILWRVQLTMALECSEKVDKISSN